jgi:hypothetical protein
MTERRCERCGEPLPALARRDQRFCKAACRVAAHRRRQAAAEDDPSDAAALLRAALDNATQETQLLARVAGAANRAGGWRAAAFLLERRYPERWGPQRATLRAHGERLPGDELDVFTELDELAAKRRQHDAPPRLQR